MYKIFCSATLLFLFGQNSWAAQEAVIHVCFTPGGSCSKQIIDAVAQAKKQVLVQAYSFTSFPIARALADAKKRGVDVEVLLDKSQLRSKGSVLPYLNNQSIMSKIDYLPAIAHNKVIILDDSIVITGSYNFTASAEKRNAENLLIIRDKNLAQDYANNWVKRERLSK
jgi:phospholipase D